MHKQDFNCFDRAHQQSSYILSLATISGDLTKIYRINDCFQQSLVEQKNGFYVSCIAGDGRTEGSKLVMKRRQREIQPFRKSQGLLIRVQNAAIRVFE